MTAAQILHKWTREVERTFPNPGKIADKFERPAPTGPISGAAQGHLSADVPEARRTSLFTSDTDWRTGRLIDDTFTQQAPDSQERNAAVYLFGYVLMCLFAVVIPNL